MSEGRFYLSYQFVIKETENSTLNVYFESEQPLGGIDHHIERMEHALGVLQMYKATRGKQVRNEEA
jgi:hypothetical protein